MNSLWEQSSYNTLWANKQSVPGGKVNILGGHSVGHSKQKYLKNKFPIPNGFRDRAIWMYNHKIVDK